MLQSETTQHKAAGLTVPLIWLKVRGTLKGKRVHGLAYQKKIRHEWEERLKKLYGKHATR